MMIYYGSLIVELDYEHKIVDVLIAVLASSEEDAKQRMLNKCREKYPMNRIVLFTIALLKEDILLKDERLIGYSFT